LSTLAVSSETKLAKNIDNIFHKKRQVDKSACLFLNYLTTIQKLKNKIIIQFP